MEQILIAIGGTVGGSLINFIATKLYNYLTGGSKNFIWRDKYPNLKNYQNTIGFDELKKRTRILVIDDEDSFPISLFQAESYAIEKWETVKDYGKLESGYYDIIVLDIKGVALHISAEDGMGVLDSLKRNNPAQIIIAYSQHSFDFSKAHFWELADEKIAKPSDFLKIKSIIDNLINTLFRPERYTETLHQILRKEGYHDREIKRLDNELIKSIKEKKEPDWNKALKFIDQNNELSKQIKTIAGTILKLHKNGS